MKFTCSVQINLPPVKVIPLFNNSDNYSKWQDGFVSLEQLSGNPGEKGAKSRFIYQSGKKTIELIETIIENRLPSEFTALYEAKEMTNIMKNTFTPAAPGKTKYTAEIEYIKFSSIMMKIMSLFLKQTFRKQTQKWLEQFKVFAESN